MDSVDYQFKFGKLKIYADEKGVSRISFNDHKRAPKKIKAVSNNKALNHLNSATQELNRYFEGKALSLKRLKLHAYGKTAFEKEVIRQLLRVESGRTISYGELARRAGSPRAARAVGSVMRRNPFPIFIPCHRVLPKSKKVGNYAGGQSLKKNLLAHEGICV